MSRGPGKVERAIEAAMLARPDDALMAEWLVQIVFPGLNRIEKRHRVSVLRAVGKVLPRVGWWARKTPSGSLVYFNPYSARSLAMSAQLATWRNLTAYEVAKSTDERPEHGDRYYMGVLPGGEFDKLARENRARRDGDIDEADRLRAAIIEDAREALRVVVADINERRRPDRDAMRELMGATPR